MKSFRYELPGGGNIYVARLHTTDEGFAYELAEKAGEIGASAWGEADWMLDIAGGDRSVAHELTADLFHNPDRQEKRQETIIDNSPKFMGKRAIVGAFDCAAISPERMVGYAAVEPDVSGTAAGIGLKKAYDVIAPFVPVGNSRVYTKLEAINVDPAEQGNGIGLALFATILECGRFYRHLTAYTEEHNDAMRTFLEKCGFKWTGDAEEKTHYFGEDYPTSQVRAQSKQDKIGTTFHLRHEYPWLGVPTKITA